MPIAVFTPTNAFGGLDVNWASICRQTLAKDIVWFVADELLDRRKHIYSQFHESGRCAGVISFRVPRREGSKLNLASSYAKGMELARGFGCEIFISLQDYIWLPPDSAEKMLSICRQADPCIPSALCSITDNPTVDKVVDPEGLLTIFAEPYTSKPEDTYWWSDLEVRGKGLEPSLYDVPSCHYWELNWAAVSNSVLYSDIAFDDEFDMRGISCENHDYAQQAITKCGAKVILDTTQHTLGLPHKLYFPKRTEMFGTLTEPARAYFMEKWGF